MPSVFSRRRGGSTSSRNTPLDASTSSSAALAASQAFIHRNPSTASLSSAAAAAALRSHTTSPEPIGSIQTKRMVRRGSVTSVGSGSIAGSVAREGGNTNGRAPLQRTNSSGSMTDRTFRTPSPGRTNGANGLSSPGYDVPPVPAIPANVGIHRSSSVEPHARVMSPAPQRGRRGASVDRAHQQPPATPQSINRLSNLSDLSEQGSPSVNFSRPMSPPPGSPTSPAGTANKYIHTDGSWHTGASGPGTKAIGQRQTSAAGSAQAKIDRIMAGAGTAPVRSDRVVSGQGTHLSQVTNSQPRPQSAQSARQNEYTMVYDPSSRTFIQKPKEQTLEQAPPSPQFATSKPDPGVWDPNTRSFLPRQSRSVTASPVPPPATLKLPKQRPVLAAVDTDIAPPPKNPARYSPVPPSPSSPRLDGLTRQPSVILEDPESEARAETSTAAKKSAARTISPPPVTKQASQALERVVSLEVSPKAVGAGRGRNSSVSPQRSAHFSPSPVLEPTRHVPPPRDFSPAKSAMKHSPASSVRATSPMTSFKSPPSEISDTVSDVGSQDGNLTASGGKKKKKSVRVSFDEHAQAVPAAAVQPIEPPSEDEDDAFMKPRPALPSFGSVRKSSGRVQPEPAEKVTEMPPERHEVSSDRAIGGILKNNSTREANEPLPPEVTSKEAAGYASDTSSEDELAANKLAMASTAPSESTATPVVKEPVIPVNLPDPQPAEADVPAITLLPPTPGLDEESKQHLDEADEAKDNRSSMEGIVVPGGWGVAAEPEQSEQASAPRDLGISTADEEFVEPISVASHSAPRLSDIYENDSDDDAEFSDAAEDLSDLDDGGFASLDAIVESPMVVPSKATPKKEALERVVEPAEKVAPVIAEPKAVAPPTDQENAEAPGTAVSDWSEATAYWSQLTKQQRRQMELEHLQSDDETRPSSVVAVKKAPKKKSQTHAPVKDVPAAASASASTSKAQQPLKPALKKSMRAQPGPSPATSDSVHMRQSMRSTTMAKTMRGAGAPSAESRSRPTSTASLPAASAGAALASARRPSVDSLPTQDTSRPKIQKRLSQSQRQTSSAQQQPQVSARLAKELAGANDSDSESSFKKRRRAGSTSTVESQGRYSMKRSMRGGPVEPVPPLPTDRRPTSPTSSSRGKGSLLRSLSPSGSLFGRNKMKDSPASDTGRRTTLRGSSATQRGSTTSLRPSSASAAAPAKKYKSRFPDSDDEDDDAPRGGGGFFRSRFADSDDDEPLTPVRGIPRRPGQADGDSTDLDDSDDDDPRKASRRRQKQPKLGVPSSAEIEKAMAAARRNLGLEDREDLVLEKNNVHEGDALQKGTLRGAADAEATTSTPSQQQQQQARPERPSLVTTPEKKRRSFMGSILRRNRGSTASIPQMPGTPTTSTAAAAAPAAANRPNSPTPAGSPAMLAGPIRGKLVRKNSNQTRPTTTTSTINATGTATAVGGQITTTPATTTSQSNGVSSSPTANKIDSSDWPLPPPIPDDEPSFSSSVFTAAAERPNTSDGVSISRTMRPNLQPRSASGQVVRSPSSATAATGGAGGAAGGTGAGGRVVRIQAGEEGSEPGERAKDLVKGGSAATGKKKKFGMLRRAFKLDD